jgi:hypothetical protein
MIQPTFPGVYVQERASGVRPITGVPTAIAAFVGYTKSGIEHEPTRIQSFADFERAFGGLARDSELSYAVSHFFANGGAEAIIVRVPKTDAAKARISVAAEDDTECLALEAISSGAWGNAVTVDIDYGPGLAASELHLTVTDTRSGRSETFGDLSMDPAAARFVRKVVNDKDTGSTLVRADIVGGSTKRPRRTRSISGDVAYDPTKLKTDKNYTLKITIDLPASKIGTVEATVAGTGDTAPASLAELCALIEARLNTALEAKAPGAAVRCQPVQSADKTQIAVWAVLDQTRLPGSLDPLVTLAAGTTNDALAMLGPAMGLAANTSLAFTANLSRYLLGTARTAAGGLKSKTVGSDGAANGSTLPKAGELIGSAGEPPKGLGCLDKVDLFTLLAIPDCTRAKLDDPNVAALSDTEMNQVWAAAIQLCERRRAFLLIDTPPQVRTVAAAAGWKGEKLAAKGNHGAAYFPRLRAADPLDRFRLRTFAPSGAVAGVFARTDANRGVWKAPAGIDAFLNGVEAPEAELTDPQHGLLNPLGLNVLRRFPVYGTVCFGARTIEGADVQGSEWKYVPVRRTANYIEESLFRGLKWVVFEPNDEPLWAQIRMNVRAFMHGLFLQGAFAGTSPRDAYLVKCDAETTTPDDVNKGIVNILVGFAPLKPAEFVILTLTQLAGQAQS